MTINQDPPELDEQSLLNHCLSGVPPKALINTKVSYFTKAISTQHCTHSTGTKRVHLSSLVLKWVLLSGKCFKDCSQCKICRSLKASVCVSQC